MNSKQITVLVRYFIKATLAIVYLVRNGENKEYVVTMNANGTSGCVAAATGSQCEGCEYGHDCYHKLACMNIEGLRGVYVQTHGSLAGFKFVAPVEEKPARKARTTYKFDAPVSVAEMAALREKFESTTAKGEHKALIKLFTLMADDAGMISIKASKWHFDGTLLFEIVTLPEECPVDVSQLSESASNLPELPQVEEEVLNNDPLTEEEAALFKQIDNDEIVLSDEIKVEEEWTAKEEDLTPAQAASLVMACVKQIAANCDGAKEDDGVGFNGTDASWGRWMARRSEIKPDEILQAAYRLKKYNRTQLDGKLKLTAIERALAPKVPSTLPQAPKFTGVDYSQKGKFGGQGFNLMR